MKINWGHKLVFFMILFMGFIVWLVVRISNQKVDLVDKNYYEKGVKYQDEINKYKASEGLGYTIKNQNNQLTFSMPGFAGLSGTVFFYKPNNAGLDFQQPFSLDVDGNYVFNTSKVVKGNWQVTFEWLHNNTLMAAQKNIVVP